MSDDQIKLLQFEEVACFDLSERLRVAQSTAMKGGVAKDGEFVFQFEAAEVPIFSRWVLFSEEMATELLAQFGEIPRDATFEVVVARLTEKKMRITLTPWHAVRCALELSQKGQQLGSGWRKLKHAKKK